jgi:hypothetical protein
VREASSRVSPPHRPGDRLRCTHLKGEGLVTQAPCEQGASVPRTQRATPERLLPDHGDDGGTATTAPTTAPTTSRGTTTTRKKASAAGRQAGGKQARAAHVQPQPQRVKVHHPSGGGGWTDSSSLYECTHSRDTPRRVQSLRACRGEPPRLSLPIPPQPRPRRNPHAGEGRLAGVLHVLDCTDGMCVSRAVSSAGGSL